MFIIVSGSFVSFLILKIVSLINSTKRLTNIGLFDYWNEREYQLLKKAKKRIAGDKFSRQTIAFELIHLKNIFLVFLFCLLGATSAFLFEIIWKIFYSFLVYGK